jgi:hypothetical protein
VLLLLSVLATDEAQGWLLWVQLKATRRAARSMEASMALAMVA